MENLLSQLMELVQTQKEWQWAFAIIFSLLLTSIIKLVLNIVSKRIRKIALQTSTIWDDVLADCIDGFRKIVLFIWVFYPTSQALKLVTGSQKAFRTVIVTLTIYQLIIWGLHVIRNWRNQVLQQKAEEDASTTSAIGLIYVGAQVAFIVTIVLIGLSNLGVNIAALVAGLGVGGIAIALAAQNILGDLLASLSIVFDKPFVVGDFIAVGDDRGTVTEIGIKTTRVQSLSGEALVFSNKDLLESRIRNYKKMWQRRVIQKFGVLYSTSPDTLEKISAWVREIVARYPKLTYDRCHFMSYGASSLDFELIFFVNDPEYNVYMDLQQGVLLDIYRKFMTENVGFAFPTQTLHVETFPPLTIQKTVGSGDRTTPPS